MVEELSDFVYDISQYHTRVNSVSVDLDGAEYLITTNGDVLHDGEIVTYPYVRIALARVNHNS